MALATYTDLQAAVTSWLNRNDTNIPVTDFIKLAEVEANSRLRTRQNIVFSSVTLLAGERAVALPADCLEVITLGFATGDFEPLTKVSMTELDAAREANDLTTGTPSLYVLSSNVAIGFDKYADQPYSLALRYYEAWNLATAGTNWLLVNHPDVYLFGALAEANAWLGDSAQAEYARNRRDAAVQRILTTESRTISTVLRVDDALVGGGSYNINTD